MFLESSQFLDQRSLSSLSDDIDVILDISLLLRSDDQDAAVSGPARAPSSSITSSAATFPVKVNLIPAPSPTYAAAASSDSVNPKKKWSSEDNAKIIDLRGKNTKWKDISRHFPGRSAISCRLHYQNYLERIDDWDEESKNKFAKLYER